MLGFLKYIKEYSLVKGFWSLWERSRMIMITLNPKPLHLLTVNKNPAAGSSETRRWPGTPVPSPSGWL